MSLLLIRLVNCWLDDNTRGFRVKCRNGNGLPPSPGPLLSRRQHRDPTAAMGRRWKRLRGDRPPAPCPGLNVILFFYIELLTAMTQKGERIKPMASMKDYFSMAYRGKILVTMKNFSHMCIRCAYKMDLSSVAVAPSKRVSLPNWGFHWRWNTGAKSLEVS